MLSLTPKEKITGPQEPVTNDKMLKLTENQIENIWYIRLSVLFSVGMGVILYVKC